jgi:hypothetical protein
MSQESAIREEIASLDRDLKLETRDMGMWELEARGELYKILEDPTISKDDKAKASRDFHRERADIYQNSREPLIRQIDELSNKLNALLAAQNAPKSNANGNGKNPAIAGKYGEYGKRGEKGKSYSNGFIGSTKGLSGKSGGNGKKAK